MEAGPPRPNPDPCVTDLHHFHALVDAQDLVRAGTFTKIRVLADAIYGKVYLYRWQRPEVDAPGETVVLKKLDTAKVERVRAQDPCDERVHFGGVGNSEDALNEIGVLAFLTQQPAQCRYLLRMLGCFSDDTHTWLATEHCDGGELFAIAASGNQLEEAVVRRNVWQLLQAVMHLHRHGIAHRDISLENILVKDGDVRLMDFGQAVLLSRNGTDLRYFRPPGKSYYRAPECYVPTRRSIMATCPATYVAGDVVQVQAAGGYLCEVRFGGGAVPGMNSPAEPFGYKAAPCDTFACGVCLFILYTQLPPWRAAVLGDDLFAYVHNQGVARLLQAWKRPLLPPLAMELLCGLIRANPAERTTLEQAVASPWFAPELEAQAQAMGGAAPPPPADPGGG